jgi:hypothetical protein
MASLIPGQNLSVHHQSQVTGAASPLDESGKVGTTGLRQTEMSVITQSGENFKNVTFGGDHETLGLIDQLKNVTPPYQSESAYREDVKDYLSSHGTDGIYIVKGPVINGEQKMYAFYKAGANALHREYHGEDAKKMYKSFGESIGLNSRSEPRFINEKTKVRIENAREKFAQSKVKVQGGRETQTAGEIAGKSAKKSHGFFSYIFGKIKSFLTNAEHFFKGMDLSLKKNLKSAFKDVKGPATEMKKETGSLQDLKSSAKVEEAQETGSLQELKPLTLKVEAFQNKFIGLTVAHRNLKKNDPRRAGFLNTHVKEAISEAENLLKELKELKGGNQKELEKLKRGTEQMISVLKSISGEERVSKLNDTQERALGLLAIDVKIRKDTEALELVKLLVGMNEDEVLAIVEEQAMRSLECPNNPDFFPRGLCTKMLGILPATNPLKQRNALEWEKMSLTADASAKEREVYKNSYQAMIERADEREANLKKEQADLLIIFGGVIDVVAPGTTIDACFKSKMDDLDARRGKLIVDESKGVDVKARLQAIEEEKKTLEKLKRDIEKEGYISPLMVVERLNQKYEKAIRNATTKEERNSLLDQYRKDLKLFLSSIACLVQGKVDAIVDGTDKKDELKENLKKEIQSKVPKYNTSAYKTIPQFHGLDKILMHFRSPTVTDTLADVLKLALEEKDKLAKADPNQVGIEIKG